MGKITCERLWVKGFRNLEETVLDFNHYDSVLITGENSQGKTNFLEAIYLLLTGKSPITKDYQHVIGFDQPGMSIVADIHRENDTHRLSVKLNKDGQLQFFSTQGPIRSHIAIKRQFPVLFLSSDILYDFKESPQIRRKNIDHFAELISADYAKLLHKMEKIISQKNTLLKTSKETSQIQFWNDQFVAISYEIVKRRVHTIAILQTQVNLLIEKMKLPLIPHPLRLTYKSQIPVQNWDDYPQLLDETLKLNMQKECIVGYSLYGPHRDDFWISSENRSIFEFCSRGVNKTISFLLTLAQSDLIFEATMQYPIVLLDDTFAEIDTTVKSKIFQLLQEKCQFFYTTILTSETQLLINSKQYHIESGRLTHG